MDEHRRKLKAKTKMKNKANRVKERERILLGKDPDDIVAEIEKLHRMDLAGLLDGVSRRRLEKAIETHKAAVAKRQDKGLDAGVHAAYVYPKVQPNPEQRAAMRREAKEKEAAAEEEAVQKRLAELAGGGSGDGEGHEGGAFGASGAINPGLLFAMPASMRVKRAKPRARVAPKPAALLNSSEKPSFSIAPRVTGAAAVVYASAPASALLALSAR